MKQLNDYILERGLFTKSNYKDAGKRAYNYHPKTRDELYELVQKLVKERGNDADLNDIDTSQIADMNRIFEYSKFNGDISKWDTSKVKNMSFMFCGSNFNGDLSNWDVSNVSDARFMFCQSDFNNDSISDWDVRNMIRTEQMFARTNFDQDLSSWKYHRFCYTDGMFDDCIIRDEYLPSRR